jgi:hypothetical protein
VIHHDDPAHFSVLWLAAAMCRAAGWVARGLAVISLSAPRQTALAEIDTRLRAAPVPSRGPGGQGRDCGKLPHVHEFHHLRGTSQIQRVIIGRAVTGLNVR